MRKHKNHPAPTVATITVHIAAYLWLGWPGVLIALAAFLIGGLGTAYNAYHFIKGSARY